MFSYFGWNFYWHFIKHSNSQPQLKNLELICLENISLYDHELKDLHTKLMFKYRNSLNPNFSEGSHAAGKAVGISSLPWLEISMVLPFHTKATMWSTVQVTTRQVCVGGVTHSKLCCDEHEKLLNQFPHVLNVANQDNQVCCTQCPIISTLLSFKSHCINPWTMTPTMYQEVDLCPC